MSKNTSNSLSDIMNENSFNNELKFSNNKDKENKDILNNKQSLFNKDAYIDYARVINNGQIPLFSSNDSKVVWNDYLKDEDGRFKPNNPTNINEPIPYSYYSKNNNTDYESALDLESIISWTANYKQLRLKFQDFAYCKLLGYYPNNRLIVLRRFQGGVPDNLFNYYESSPISTLISWLPPEQETFMNITFNEKWTEHKEGISETIKNKDGDKTVTTKENDYVEVESVMGTAKDAMLAILGDTLTSDTKYKREDGTLYLDQSVAGNPNLISTTQRRVTGGGGLDSNIRFELTFEYELRYIGDIDPSVAILDIISNCIRMGTSTESFRFNIPALKNSDIVKSFMKNNMNDAYEAFAKEIKNFNDTIMKLFEDITSNIKNALTKNPINSAKNTAIDASKFIISRYREALKGAIAVDTGLPMGNWHVTIGNPQAPIVSCGDLIVKKSTLTLGSELGYNDFPDSFKVKYELETTRERGSQEIQRIFNAGRGRVYVYEDYRSNPDYYKYDDKTTI